MRDAIEILAVVFALGVVFSLGQDTWRWLSRRYVKLFHPTEKIVIKVDTKQALDAIADLQAALDKLHASESNAKGAA